MLITPAVLGTLFIAVASFRWGVSAAAWGVALCILVAWFFGYFAFFALGLVARARTAARRRAYLPPVVVYGAVSLLAALLALLFRPGLGWWAFAFGPLVAVAVWETFRGRARSVLSGASTTVASALLLPVLASTGGFALGPHLWAATALLAAYFTGSVFYVKSLIRKKGDDSFWRSSLVFHGVALAVVTVAVAVVAAVDSRSWVSGVLGTALTAATLSWALWRAHRLPARQRAGETFPPKEIGKKDIPLLLLCCVAVLAVTLGG